MCKMSYPSICTMKLGALMLWMLGLVKYVVSTCLGHVIDMSRLFCMSVSKCLALSSIELSLYRDVLFPCKHLKFSY